MSSPVNPNRRQVLKAGATLALALGLPSVVRAQDKQIVVSDPGGPYTIAYRKAFYDPFEKATGMARNQVAEFGPIQRIGGQQFGIGYKGAEHPLSVDLVQAQKCKRVGMAAANDCLHFPQIGLPVFLGHRHVPP